MTLYGNTLNVSNFMEAPNPQHPIYIYIYRILLEGFDQEEKIQDSFKKYIGLFRIREQMLFFEITMFKMLFEIKKVVLKRTNW